MSRRSSLAYHSRIAHLASMSEVHAAFQWFHLEERRIMDWQRELVAIPAPPFGEQVRARWIQEQFCRLGLEKPGIDEEGNVTAYLRGSSADALARDCILLSAHLDTAFPAGTPVSVTMREGRLQAPGACDNGAGLVAMLALAAALKHSGARPRNDILFVGNVGEEGEGDLRGMRFLYGRALPRERVRAHVVLDGAGTGTAVTEGVGSRRYLAAIDTPGGHSWVNAGSPNSIVLMSQAIMAFQVAFQNDNLDASFSTWNVGTIRGGSSVNSIPGRTEARFDFRSRVADQLVRMEVLLHRAVEDEALAAARVLEKSARPTASDIAKVRPTGQRASRKRDAVSFEIRKIGDRPPGRLQDDSSLLETLRAVDRHLGIRTEEQAASTDANIPLAMGIPAIALGAGGTGGGIHTLAEWYDPAGRDLVLRRILLLLLGVDPDC